MATSSNNSSVEKKIPTKNFVIVTHKLYNGVADDLKKYLIEHECRRLWFIAHEFASRKTRKSYIEYYENGQYIETTYSKDYSFLPEIVVNIKDFFYTLAWMILKVRNPDVYFGFGAFNVISGIILRKIISIKEIIFYTIDYVPQRYKNNLLNNFYHFLDKIALAYSSETWNLSPRMVEGRNQNMSLVKYKDKQKVVPVGVWFNEIHRLPFNKINKKELIFVGHLYKKQGVQIVLEAIPRIVKEIKDFRFRIIGDGEYEEELKKLVKKLKIEKYVIFEEAIYDQNIVNDKLSKAVVAVAMYDKESDNFTYYADPTKLKTYLACGLPVLLTDLPYNAKEIESKGCGRIIDYDKNSVSSSLIELMKNDEVLNRYRKNAEKYARSFDWETIFETNLGRII